MLRWGLVFLHCPLRLDEEHKQRLVLLAARAYFEDEGRIPFAWDQMSGEVTVQSDAVALGGLVGQKFEAEVHTTEGESATLSFLVTEQVLRQSWTGPVAEA